MFSYKGRDGLLSFIYFFIFSFCSSIIFIMLVDCSPIFLSASPFIFPTSLFIEFKPSIYSVLFPDVEVAVLMAFGSDLFRSSTVDLKLLSIVFYFSSKVLWMSFAELSICSLALSLIFGAVSSTNYSLFSATINLHTSPPYYLMR